MLGHWPIATRPIATFRGAAVGPILAALTTAGVGGFISPMRATGTLALTSAGNGTLQAVSDSTRATLTTSGTSTVAFSMKATAGLVLQAAGVGSTGFAGKSIASSTFSSNGSAALVPVVRAQAFSASNMQGSGNLGASDAPSSVTSMQGFGTFAATGYSFFVDSEVAGPAYEVRTAFVAPKLQVVDEDCWLAAEPRVIAAGSELRVSVAPVEDRVYYVSNKAASPGPPNRKRIL